MSKKGKPGWETPHLVVLERSRPEEAVLTSCKHPSMPVVSSSTINVGCKELKTDGGGGCGACWENSSS